MNSRIQLILKTKNISASKFADEIGVQRSSISHILSGRNNPSLDFIQKTLMRFPDISPDWILTGKGSMYMQPDLFSVAGEPKHERVSNDEDLSYSGEDISDNAELITEIEERIEPEKEKQLKQKPNRQIEKPQEILKKEQQVSQKEKSQENLEKQIPQIFAKTEERKIERIIIFYSDKTCLQYIPE